jgi:hypothetical protein
MKIGLLFIASLIVTIFFISVYDDFTKDPYKEGGHNGYIITCENGFMYKIYSSSSNLRGVVQILNSDGTPAKCGHKIY